MDCSRSRFHLIIPGMVLVAVTFWSAAVQAGGFSNLDFGTRRMGMFAVVARPDDGTAIYHNPAGLTLTEGSTFYHHQSWIIGDTKMKLYDSQGNLRPDHEIGPDWSLGFTPFLSVASDFGTEKFRAGLGLYVPNGYGALLPDDEPSRYHATQALFVASRVTAAAAWKFSNRFSLGASVSLVHVYLSAERYMNPLVLADPDARFLPLSELEPLDARMEITGMDLSWAWDVGMLFRPVDTFRIGLLFASGAPIDLEGDVVLHYNNGNTEKTVHSTGMQLPFTLRGGINWEFAPDFEFATDIVYWHYQVLQEQRTTLKTPIMGLSSLVDPKNYHNSYLWCAGLLYHLTPEWELMMGFQLDYTPIPEETFTLESSVRDTMGVSAGARWQATDTLRVGLAATTVWNELVDVQTSIGIPPSNAKGYGKMSMIGADLEWRFL